MAMIRCYSKYTNNPNQSNKKLIRVDL